MTLRSWSRVSLRHLLSLVVFVAGARNAFPACPGFAAPATVNVGGNPSGIAKGDFNGDGRIDLAVTNFVSNTISILMGNGNGTFSAAANVSIVAPQRIAAGDFNGDGKVDLVVASNHTTVTIFLGNGGGAFTFSQSSSVTGAADVAVGDFNGDGNLDALVSMTSITGLSQNLVVVILGDGAGGFGMSHTKTLSNTTPLAVGAGDFDGDGKLDAVVDIGDSGNVAFLPGNGDGTFGTEGTMSAGSSVQAIAVADLNGDGKLDFVAPDSGSGFVFVFMGDGAGGFTSTPYNLGAVGPYGVAVVDFNGDGKLDLATGNSSGGTVSILLGDGMGSFGSAASFTANATSSELVAADFDGDGKYDVAVANAGPFGSTVSILINNSVCVAAPTVTNVSPNRGPSAGGQAVTITGTNLTTATSVTFGGTAATLGTITATSIAVTTPAHAAGLVDVVVTTAGGTATATGAYTYVDPPTITSVGANQGPIDGGQRVQISGTNFEAASFVSFGGAPATSITVVNSSTINAFTPAHAAGVVDVTVSTAFGQGTLTGGYTYFDAPTITSVFPTYGPDSGGTNVSITGTNFFSPLTVTLGGQTLDALPLSTTLARVVTNPHAAGSADVAISNLQGSSSTLAGAFTFDATPAITGISPPTGPEAGGQSITITGSNFFIPSFVTIDGAPAAVTLGSTTQLDVVTPPHSAGAVDVVVSGRSTSATATLGYTYVSPVVADAGGPYTANLDESVLLSGAATSVPTGNSIVAYTWMSGASTIGSGVSPTLTTAQLTGLGVGSHPVTLTVTDIFGASSAASTTLTIYDNRPMPSFTATPNPATCSQSVAFDASATIHGRPDRNIVSYTWDFGDSSQAGSGVTANHTYAPAGQYTVTLTVTDNNVPPKTATATTLLTVAFVNHAPVANAGGPYTFDAGAPVTLNGGGSTDADSTCGDLLSYQWKLDGSLVGTQRVQALSSPSEGTHTLTLTVTDTAGASSTSSTTLTILAVPCIPPSGVAVSASSTLIDAGDLVTLTATVASGDGPMTITWFADGEPLAGLSDSTITVRPARSTTYAALAMNFCGASPGAGVRVVVRPLSCTTAVASVTATPNPAQPAESVHLTANATTTSGTLSYAWYRGATGDTTAGVIGTASSLAVSPSTTTTYWVLVSSSCGSTATGEVTVTVNAGECGSNPLSVCLNDTRYRLDVVARDPAGNTAEGIGHYQSPKFGWFSFPTLTGDENNPEVFAKIVGPVNGVPWVFYAGLTNLDYTLSVVDTTTGRPVNAYHVTPPEPGSLQNFGNFDLGGTTSTSCLPVHVESAQTTPGACRNSDTTLCLLDRFSVSLDAADNPVRSSRTSAGGALPVNRAFGFFTTPDLSADPSDVQAFVKMIDARGPFGSFWLFFGGLTDFQLKLTVTDTTNGAQKIYTKPAGSTCGWNDVSAFQ